MTSMKTPAVAPKVSPQLQVWGMGEPAALPAAATKA